MKTKVKGNPYLSWILRILLILVILLFALFSLDVFEEGKGFWETLADFLGHNIPSFVMIVILMIAWRNELVGGIILILGVIGFGIFLHFKIDHVTNMLGIPLLIGALFVVNHYFLGKKQAA